MSVLPLSLQLGEFLRLCMADLLELLNVTLISWSITGLDILLAALVYVHLLLLMT